MRISDWSSDVCSSDLRPLQQSARIRAAVPEDGPAQPRPHSLESFLTWLAQDAAQPERRWPGAAIMPAGPVDAPLMVITDMPDPVDIGAGTLPSDRAGQLFDAMFRAIGLQRQAGHRTTARRVGKEWV